ncbi:squalene/phytoene synthase family protein [Streptomyces ipomoeae]|uniref:squalene/phytoene synthase family protein n=1 Tax=Streptomyces ipomoeae TaxID=103232 RepID=UPI0011474BD7|nr:squalene/phytoene synthase family protein [Streptomyces ipomoeae]MDX2934455.1 squalene/phytoene synthase family protein [Streptomyces ipomoeae]TQE17415.1 phytoene/squalene synthetase [Streptomyces ipomoeae]
MSAWNHSLNAAGIQEPQLRKDYGTQRRLVARFRRASYLAARLLLPRAALPHVVAATAFMHHGDNLLDTGPRSQRATAWAIWEQDVRKALDTGASDDPLIRTLLHTMGAYPRLREVLEEYLSTATADLEFTRFTTEGDYQAYVDAYSLPGFMLIASLLGPEDDDGRFRAGCRTFIDAGQRLDFTNDLAEDLREGRLGIPLETLERFSVTVEDLAAGHAAAGVEQLIVHQVTAARTGLEAAGELTSLVAAPYRALVGALIEIELLTAEAALACGAGLLRGPASPPVAGTLRVLFNARRKARVAPTGEEAS